MRRVSERSVPKPKLNKIELSAQELKRVGDKREEALSEAGTLRAETERLTEMVETLRAAATAASAATGTAVAEPAADAAAAGAATVFRESATTSTQADDTEAQNEMARLRKKIEELEQARESDSAGGVSEGGGKVDGVSRGEGGDREGDKEAGEGKGQGQERGETTQGAGGKEASSQRKEGAVEDRDGLRVELQQARQEAAARAAALEMQLIDKEVRVKPLFLPSRPVWSRPVSSGLPIAFFQFVDFLARQFYLPWCLRYEYVYVLRRKKWRDKRPAEVVAAAVGERFSVSTLAFMLRPRSVECHLARHTAVMPLSLSQRRRSLRCVAKTQPCYVKPTININRGD